MGSLVGCIFHYLQVHIIKILRQKRLDPRVSIREVNEVDIYKFDPFELPGLSEHQSDDQVWYFFSEPYFRNVSSKKPQRVRATGAGYWKSTGQGCVVRDRNCKILGSKRTLVFYRRERGRPSKETKTNWVMHEFYIEDNPCYKKNFVFCYIEKQQNKKSSVSTPGDGQPSSSLASDSINHFVEDTYNEVQSQELPSDPLISDTANDVGENTFTEVAPQPVSSQNLVSDSRNNVSENLFSMVDAYQKSSQILDSDSSYNVAGLFIPLVKSQLLQGQNMASDPANHVPKNIVSTVEPDQPLSSHNMVSDLGNHMSGNSSLMVEPQAVSPCNLFSKLGNHVLKNNFPRVEPQLQLSYNMASDSRNHVKNAFSMVAPQLPLCHNMVFGLRNHVAENTFYRMMKSMRNCSSEHQPLVDLQLPPGQYSVSDSINQVAGNTCSKVDSSPSADFGALDGCNGLNFSSFSAPQIPINPEQGSQFVIPHHREGNSPDHQLRPLNDCLVIKEVGVQRQPGDGVHEAVAELLQDFQDENLNEGTGQTLPADTDAETTDMIEELYEDIPLIDYVNHN